MHIVLYHSHDFGRSWGEPTTVPCVHPPLLLLFCLVLTGVFSMAGCRIGPDPRPSLRPCSVRHSQQSCTCLGCTFICC